MLKKLLRLAFYFLPLILFLAHPKEPRAAVTSAASPRNDFPSAEGDHLPESRRATGRTLGQARQFDAVAFR